MKERQKSLGDLLDLSSYLLTPIQRLGKYILLLENIQKALQKENKYSENVEMAIEMLRREMRIGNDFIAIDSIEKLPITLDQSGSFVFRDVFNIQRPRKYEATLFLFENVLVFTVVHHVSSNLQSVENNFSSWG